jgi:hypothetical protein
MPDLGPYECYKEKCIVCGGEKTCEKKHTGGKWPLKEREFDWAICVECSEKYPKGEEHHI